MRPDTTAAETLFRSAFGSEPTVLAAGPGRVNLIGEHTDYNEGFVLPFAIDRVAVAAIRPRPDRGVRVVSDFAEGLVHGDLGSLASTRGWAAYPLGVAWAMLQADNRARESVGGFDLALVSNVPVGAGLSSSAAIESATAVALDRIWGLGLDRRALARIGQHAENEVVGAPTGIMDQCASLLGRRDAAVFLDCRSLHAESIELGLESAHASVLVVDTKVTHAHADGGYGARRASCERGAEALGVPSLREVCVSDLGRARGVLDPETFRRVRHVVTENQRVIDTVDTLRDKGPNAVGELLAASHASMRDDFEISTPELDAAVDAATSAGAIGARMTGGGFGGSAIAVVANDRLDAVSEAVRRAFADADFTAPELFVVRAAAGAEVLHES